MVAGRRDGGPYGSAGGMDKDIIQSWNEEPVTCKTEFDRLCKTVKYV